MRSGDKLRSWVWHRLVYLADRISPEDAFRATGLYFHMKKGAGAVLDDKGVQIWYKGQDYNEHSHDGYDESPVLKSEIRSGDLRISSDMAPDEVEKHVKQVLWWYR